MSRRRSGPLPAAYFEELYSRDPDPWRFATSDYEAAKYDATLSALPRSRYRRALEVGCSIGVLTERLARRCDEIIATDIAPSALERARERCGELPHVSFQRAALPMEAPEGTFDLVLLSEVIYYWDEATLLRAAGLLRRLVAPGGDLLLVHWTRATDYPLSGDRATALLLEAFAGSFDVLESRRAPSYRLDLLRRSARAADRQGPRD